MRDVHDVIIIGCGIAGISAAIFLKEAGLEVIVFSKEHDPQETATNYAQGGIIGWRKNDAPQLLADDIIKAGCFYNYKKAVNQFVEKGPALVTDFLIDKLGIKFSRDESGKLDYTEEAAHSKRRILHYEDHTGEKIQRVLLDYARSVGVKIQTNSTSIDLITNNHHSSDYQELYKSREVMGIYVLNQVSGKVETRFAHYVIVASGGLGNLYQYTSNPIGATGDGLSMAYRAGANIINAELIQFHPTSLFHRDIKRFLISESLRGEGAKLIDHEGDQFMKKYSTMAELAPRDIVARAIFEEMNQTGKPYLLLDIHSYYKGNIPLKKRFSNIYHTCLKGGIDISREPIPVVPAAHYFCGGIKVDLNGKSNISNLFAIGEVSCTGLHGANRLASSSLPEGLVWAKTCSEIIKKRFKKISEKRFSTIPDWVRPSNQIDFDPILIKQDWQSIQSTMWNYVGIIRTIKGLERAKADINYFYHRILKFYKEATLNREIIELRNAVVNASIIINAASHNKKSIGCHYIKE